MAGSDWKLGPEAAQQEPQFSTWEDVRKAQERRRAGFDDGGGGGRGGPADTAYYQLLEVGPSASKAEIKASYRQLALRLHPDVNSAPDAAQRFAEVAGAYDVLSDPASRTLYDRFGAEGMKRHAGAAACLLPAGLPACRLHLPQRCCGQWAGAPRPSLLAQVCSRLCPQLDPSNGALCRRLVRQRQRQPRLGRVQALQEGQQAHQGPGRQHRQLHQQQRRARRQRQHE